MKKRLLTYILRIAFISVFAVSGISCIKEDEPAPDAVIGEEVLVDLEFNAPASEKVSIGTKAAMSDYFENQVKNIYLIIFDASGKRRYIHYFSDTNLKSTEDELDKAVLDAWWVEQKQDKVAQTHGKIRMRVNKMSGAKLYAVANINGAFVNVTPERLNIVGTEGEYRNVVATMLQEQAFRNNSMLMTGESGMDISDKITLATGNLHFYRLDAKINVKVRSAEGYTVGGADGAGSKLKKFIPSSIEIFNLPRGCGLVADTGDDSEFVENLGYFNTEGSPFETTSSVKFTSGGEDFISDEYGFTFYMLENRHSAKKTVPSVQARELRAKDLSTGKYLTDTDPESDMWEYAPESGTYVCIKGEVVMDVSVAADAKTQALSGDVEYIVHLGSFSGDLSNFKILRNHEYTYTITVKGVDKIELEVTSSHNEDGSMKPNPTEDNPGASGHVNVAKESVYTFDAHYGQRLFKFSADNIDVDHLEWYVKSPFGLEGIPSRDENGILNAAPYDYKWVHFMTSRQSKKQIDGKPNSNYVDYEGEYKPLNEAYPGDGSDELMDIIKFTDYIIAQKRKFDENKAGGVTPVNKDTDFRLMEDSWETIDGITKTDKQYRLCITVFVDEYYYKSNPVDGTPEDLSLWKQFVNQDNRVMYILSDSRTSTDGDSNSTGSVITIRQRAIQTPFAVREGVDIERAWGTECVNETGRTLFFFSPDETFKSNSYGGYDMNIPDSVTKPTGNNSKSNGLYNQTELLGLNNVKNGSLNWSTYMNYERVNDYKENNYNCVFLQGDYMAIRYACLMRNRDNNGDGKINPEEMRWYLASENQLYDLYIGELGLPSSARLYDPAYSSLGDDYKFGRGAGQNVHGWRNHLVSSTAYNNGDMPTKIWAEQGVSSSAYSDSWEAKPVFDYRCVRNLGIPDPTSTTIDNKDDGSVLPEEMVAMKSTGTGEDAVYSFDLRKLNRASSRFYVVNELEPGDENSYQARTYFGFQTGPAYNLPTVTGTTGYDYNNLKTDLENGKTYCPTGYRVPNIREATIMKQLILKSDNSAWWNSSGIFMSSSYSSMGAYGNGKMDPQFGWNINDTNINMSTGSDHVAHNIRCVRDLSLDEISAIFD